MQQHRADSAVNLGIITRPTEGYDRNILGCGDEALMRMLKSLFRQQINKIGPISNPELQ